MPFACFVRSLLSGTGQRHRSESDGPQHKEQTSNNSWPLAEVRNGQSRRSGRGTPHIVRKKSLLKRMTTAKLGFSSNAGIKAPSSFQVAKLFCHPEAKGYSSIVRISPRSTRCPRGQLQPPTLVPKLTHPTMPSQRPYYETHFPFSDLPRLSYPCSSEFNVAAETRCSCLPSGNTSTASPSHVHFSTLPASPSFAAGENTAILSSRNAALNSHHSRLECNFPLAGDTYRIPRPGSLSLKVLPSMAELLRCFLSPCYPNFDAISAILVQQAEFLVKERYHGSYHRFRHEYLLPCRHILTRLRNLTRHKVGPIESVDFVWPFLLNASPLINLGPHLHPSFAQQVGDLSLCVDHIDVSPPHYANTAWLSRSHLLGRHWSSVGALAGRSGRGPSSDQVPATLGLVIVWQASVQVTFRIPVLLLLCSSDPGSPSSVVVLPEDFPLQSLQLFTQFLAHLSDSTQRPEPDRLAWIKSTNLVFVSDTKNPGVGGEVVRLPWWNLALNGPDSCVLAMKKRGKDKDPGAIRYSPRTARANGDADDLGISPIQTPWPFHALMANLPHIDSESEEERNPEASSHHCPPLHQTELTSAPSPHDNCSCRKMESAGEIAHCPLELQEIPETLLYKGIYLPGVRDTSGRAVIVIELETLASNLDSVHNIAKLLLYYYAIPRKSATKNGIVGLICGCPQQFSTGLQLVDQALHLAQAKLTKLIAQLLVWNPAAHPITQPPEFPPNLHHQYTLAKELPDLVERIPAGAMLSSCGGTWKHNQQDWVLFRKKVEPFLNQCRQQGKQLYSAIAEIRKAKMSSSSRQVETQLHSHNTLSKTTSENPDLTALLTTGSEHIRDIIQARLRLPDNIDARETVERCTALFVEVQRACNKFQRLSDRRSSVLNRVARKQNAPQEAKEVLSWLCQRGEDTLQRHATYAENLASAKQQERDFEQFYFMAMKQIEKGNDLLEEFNYAETSSDRSSMEGSSSPESEKPCNANNEASIQDLAQSLKTQLCRFSDRLEDTRERLEDTTRCYELLDKAYDWGLEAMKMASRLKLEPSASPCPALANHLLRQLENFLRNRPPLEPSVFDNMQSLTEKLGNPALLEQCKVARARCQETLDLMKARQSILQRYSRKPGVKRDCSDAESHDTTLSLPQISHSTEFQASTPKIVSSSSQRSTDLIASNAGRTNGTHTSSCSCLDSVTATSSPVSCDEVDKACASPITRGSLVYTSRTSVHSFASSKSSSSTSTNASSTSTSSSGQSSCSSDEMNKVSSTVSKKTTSATLGRLSYGGNFASKANLLTRSLSYEPPSAKPRLQYTDSVSSSSSETPEEKNAPRSICENLGETEDSGASVGSPSAQGDNDREDQEDTEDPEGDSDGRPTDSSATGAPEASSAIPSTPVSPIPVNSHLYSRASNLNLSLPLAEMEEAGLTEQQIKTQKTLLLIMREMIQTERDYVRSLEYIIENYIPELSREDIPQALRGKRNVIFGNLEKIHEFHSHYFLKELEMCESMPFLVGQCFLRHEQQFYLYALYNKNKPKSDTLLSEYGTAFFREKQMQLGDKMDLASYLLKPVQRMGKYALLLKQLLKESDEKEPEYPDLLAAEQMVRFQLRHGNDLLAMDSLRDCDVNVKEQGRLLRQNEFLVWQGRKKGLRHVFLFEDLVLFSKAKRDPERKNLDNYIYKHSMKISDIGMTAQVGDSKTKFEIWFRKRKLNDLFLLQSMSPETKDAWVEDLSRLLWKQAFRNRELRMAEMVEMGVGNKPCLDIRPSQDQINDRSISFTQLCKAPRFRQSITSINLGDGHHSKRPHSIISVSSSSGSSSGCSGVIPNAGALNLAFDPVDSPRAHRSTNQSQCSNESGIMADLSNNFDETEAGNGHRRVGRSDSSITTMSVDSGTPMSPMSPDLCGFASPSSLTMTGSLRCVVTGTFRTVPKTEL